MLTNEQILESIAEAIRCQRRFGPNYPTTFDLSHITWDADKNVIKMNLVDRNSNKRRFFFLTLEEVGEIPW